MSANIRRIATIAVLGLLLATATAAGASDDVVLNPETSSTRVPGRYIVVFKDSVRRPASVAETQTGQLGGELGPVYWAGLKGYAAELSQADVDALRRDPRVDYISPDRKGIAADQTVPTGVDRIFNTANPAADIDGSDDVRVDADVAVIDTGVDHTHPDLNVAGYSDCTLEENKCIANAGEDVRGHGTHVAGVIGALDNGFGSVGVAPGARIWSLKGIGDDGIGYMSWWLSAVDWVTAHADSIEVANMSLGCRCALSEEFEEVPVFAEAIKASTEAGVVYTVAAMNFGEDASLWTPAALPDVVSVSALTDLDGLPGGLSTSTCAGIFPGSKDDRLAPYSNRGSAVDIAAPGECIYSTRPMAGSLKGAEYGFGNGTSAASPHVAGAAALLAAADNPNTEADVNAIRQKLINQGSLNWFDDSGDGIHEPLLDLRAAAPEAITQPASKLRPYSARLNALVNLGGSDGSYRFEYGPTAAYGTTTPAGESLPIGAKDAKVGAWIEVEPQTTYHYRVVVTSEQGTAYGEDRTFTAPDWSLQAIPAPSGNEKAGDLADVSCASTSQCMAVGSKLVSSDGVFYRAKAFAERWNGAAWSIVPVPNLGGSSPASRLDQVSCSSPESCLAIGSSAGQPIAASWNGTGWAPVGVTLPSQAKEATLSDVSCASASACVVVGSYSESTLSLEARMLIQRWDGSQWNVQAAPDVQGNLLNKLAGVSCASARHCVAVGSTRKAPYPSPLAAIAAEWNGATWTATPTPATPEGVPTSKISCASEQFCLTTGAAASSTFASTWDGVSWQLRSTGIDGSAPTVSCAAARSCDLVTTATGAHWNGRELLQRGLAAPDESSEVRVKGISCPARGTCAGVGSYVGAGKTGTLPLAQRVVQVHQPRVEADAHPTSIVGVQSPGLDASFFLGGVPSHCAGFYEGEATQASASLSLEAEYSQCWAFGFNNAAVEMKTCDYVLRLDNAGPPYTGSLDVTCAKAGDAIRVVGGSCEAEIEPQTGLKGVSLANAGNRDAAGVEVEIAASGVKYTVLKDGFLCPLSGTGSFANGSMEAAFGLEGERAGSAVDLFLAGEKVDSNGLRVAGEKSAEPAKQPRVEADSLPSAVIAGQSEVEIAMGTVKSQCKVAYEGEATQASASLSLEAEYSQCWAFGFNNAAVEMKTCDYVLRLDNAGPPYTGSLDVTCAKAGDAIRVVGGSCEAEIEPQTGLKGVSLTTTGTGGAARVSVTMGVSGIKYTVLKDGFLCPLSGTGSFANGELEGAFELGTAL